MSKQEIPIATESGRGDAVNKASVGFLPRKESRDGDERWEKRGKGRNYADEERRPARLITSVHHI
jgi:hypothetical protein